MTAPVFPPGFARAWLALPGLEVVDLSHRRLPGHAERLRTALEMGLPAEPDPRRDEFYEALVGGYRYYFHVVPAAAGHPAKAYLLATMR